MAQEALLNGSACLFCGGTDFTWGKLDNPRGKVTFFPDGPFFTVVSTNEVVKARECEGCGNIQCFTEQ